MSQITMSTVRNVEQILHAGESQAKALAPMNICQELGLWVCSSSDERCVATGELLRLSHLAASPEEAVTALLSCHAEIREAWQRIIAARLRELGQRRDVSHLCESINTLGQASDAIAERIPKASLQSTPFETLEREILGAPAHEAIATPKLLRAIGVSAHWVEGDRATQQELPPPLNRKSPANNWVQGRLIQPPTPQSEAARLVFVLSGALAGLGNENEEKHQGGIPWVLAHPWAYLLAQLVFTQEAWSAERISGRLALELEASHQSRYEKPPQVAVVVTNADGDEVVCGTLGEWVLRVLGQLGVTLLASKEVYAQLDDALAEVISHLLRHQIWDFSKKEVRGRPSYRIHENFSDACYRAVGVRTFHREGAHITAAIRRVCESWARERLFRSRVLGGEA